MAHIETDIFVKATPEACYRIASDMERFSEFMKDVDEVTVLERGEGWTLSRWVSRLQGKPVKWIERDEFDDDQLTIQYRQTEGDLKTFEGLWTFTSEDDGCRVRLTVEASLGVPMLAVALDPLISKLIRDNCNDMLAGIKAEAERS